METFSALLAICVGNSPVPVNSPHKDQWHGALMFSLISAWINGWVNQSRGWWFETKSCPLWRHCNAPCHPWPHWCVQCRVSTDYIVTPLQPLRIGLLLHWSSCRTTTQIKSLMWSDGKTSGPSNHVGCSNWVRLPICFHYDIMFHYTGFFTGRYTFLNCIPSSPMESCTLLKIFKRTGVFFHPTLKS